MTPQLTQSIEECDFSIRVSNVLDGCGAKTLGDVIVLSNLDILLAEGSNRKVLMELTMYLMEMGLTLSDATLKTSVLANPTPQLR